MTVRRTGKGKAVVVHCHGKSKGRRIAATKKPVSVKKAGEIHRAIQATRRKK